MRTFNELRPSTHLKGFDNRLLTSTACKLPIYLENRLAPHNGMLASVAASNDTFLRCEGARNEHRRQSVVGCADQSATH
jgi:hypothetical protein